MMGPLTGHHDDLIHVAPDPVLPRLEGLYERVPGGVEVLGRVFVLGVVATSYVSADQALPKMDPGVAHLQALLAAVRARLYVLDLVQVRAVRRHLQPPSLIMRVPRHCGPLRAPHPAPLLPPASRPILCPRSGPRPPKHSQPPTPLLYTSPAGRPRRTPRPRPALCSPPSRHLHLPEPRSHPGPPSRTPGPPAAPVSGLNSRSFYPGRC